MAGQRDIGRRAASPRRSRGPADPLVASILLHLEKETQHSPHTVKAYARDLDAFAEFCGRHYGGAWTLGRAWTGSAVRGFLGELQRRGLSQALRGAGAVGGAQLLPLPAGASRRRRRRSPRAARGAEARQAAARPISTASRRTTLFACAEARAAGDDFAAAARPRDARALLLDRACGSRSCAGSNLGDARPALRPGQGARQGAEGADRPGRRRGRCWRSGAIFTVREALARSPRRRTGGRCS